MRRFLFALLILCVPAWPQGSTTWTIDTFAGSMPPPEGPALEAFLSSPGEIAVDDQGRLLITDRILHWVRSVENGRIQLFAGNGAAGSPRPQEPAAEASLFLPYSLAAGNNGDVFIGSSARIYRVDANGLIEPVMGSGGRSQDPPRDLPALEAPLGTLGAAAYDRNRDILYVVNNETVIKLENGRVDTFAGTGDRGTAGDGGPAIAAEFRSPTALAVAPNGELFIGESGNSGIRRVDATGVIDRVVGTGTYSADPIPDGTPALEADVPQAYALAFDAQGRLYFADERERIYRLNADNTLSLAFDYRAQFGGGALIQGLAFDAQGNLYMSDEYQAVVRMLPAGGGAVRAIAGGSNLRGDGGPADQARLHRPNTVTFDDRGRLLILDTDNQAIRAVSPEGVITTIAGNGELIPDRNNDGEPAVEQSIGAPQYFAAAPSLQVLYATDRSIRTVDSDGLLGTLPGLDDSLLVGPLATLPNGDIYFATVIDPAIYRLRAGSVTKIAGTGERGFGGDGGPALQASFSAIHDLAFDTAGNLFVADLGNSRIRKIDAETDIVTTVAGSGGFEERRDGEATAIGMSAYFLAVGPDGAIYFTSAFRVRRLFQPGGGEVGPGAQIETIGGITQAGFSGDGGPAIEARFSAPGGLVLGPDGRLYVADRGNHRIRVMTPAAGGVLAEGSLTNAASFAPGAAPGAIVSLFGEDFSRDTVIADSTPLPTQLAQVRVSLTDSSGAVFFVQLFFVSANQINFLVPLEAAPGPATLTVTSPVGPLTGDIVITPVAPGLFTMNATGAGVGAIVGLRVAPDGARSDVEVFAFNAGAFTPTPISLNPAQGEVYLTLFGTGIRGGGTLSATVNGVNVPILGSAPSPQFAGLDQVSIGPLPAALIGAGEVDIILTVDGRPTNAVTAAFQ